MECIDGMSVIAGDRHKRIQIGKSKYVYLHRYIVEKLTGIKLKPEQVVHHVDGNPLNNEPNNLIVLQNAKEHALLHFRMKELSNPEKYGNNKFCPRCKTIKLKNEFYKNKSRRGGLGAFCKICSKH